MQVRVLPGSRVPGFPGSRVPGFPASRLPGFPASRLPGFPASRLPGFPLTVGRAGGRQDERTEGPAAEDETLVGPSVRQATMMHKREDVGETLARNVADVEREHRHLGDVAELAGAAQLDVVVVSENGVRVARRHQLASTERTATQREHRAFRERVRRLEDVRLVPNVRVVFLEKEHVDVRPAKRPVEVSDAVILAVELPLAGRRDVAAGV